MKHEIIEFIYRHILRRLVHFIGDSYRDSPHVYYIFGALIACGIGYIIYKAATSE